MVADDQTRRAEMVAAAAPAVVSPCETPEERGRAVERLLGVVTPAQVAGQTFDLSGAERAADEILALIDTMPRARG